MVSLAQLEVWMVSKYRSNNGLIVASCNVKNTSEISSMPVYDHGDYFDSRILSSMYI
jgi:hypothetical protein